jgi:AcrR family transcriptional regulator
LSHTSNNKFLKSEQTKLRIMDVYLDLIFEKEWDKISVKEICANANITRGTFYLYFNDIYDLLEQIEDPLLSELVQKYQQNTSQDALSPPSGKFEDSFDLKPPPQLLFWFDFCSSHKKEMKTLLGSHGDPYFTTKLKNILSEQIVQMMDRDSMPHDELRSHFTKAFLELHFLAVRTWLDSAESKFLSTEEIIHVLNTMRIGANYLSHVTNTKEKDS